ncbi:MAG: DNA primase [Pseudomonadales bacterium]|nr:DNA primase [Pseudomonadales bacterium]
MAGLIPQSFINDLIDRADIVDVVGSRVALKKSGKNYSGLCPFHDEKSPSFSVSPDKQFFHCFGCQESGSALTFLMKYERMEFVEAVETLAKDLGLTVPREKSNRNYVEVDQRIFQALEKAERVYKQQLRGMPAAVDYLKGRGLTGVTARDFGIGYAPEGWHSLSEVLLDEDVSAEVMLKAGLTIKNDSGRVYDRFRHRIMFPIRDVRGRVIGFGGRKLGDEEGPKYLNSPETPVFAKNQELYGLYEARKALRNIDRLLVVEGYMDVVALAQGGFRNAVATLGTATGEAHYQKLYRYTDEVVCCFDGDKAGRAAAWRALESALPVLNEHRQLKFVFLPDGEDPDSLVRDQGAEAFSEFLQNATPGIEYLFNKLGEGLDLQSLDGRARFMGLANPYVEKIPAGILQQLVRKRVREIGGMETGTIRPAGRESKPRVSMRDDGEFGPVLAQRLIGMLLKAPSLWIELDKNTQAELLAHHKELGVLGRLVSLLDAQPESDTNEILIAWPEEGEQQRLIELAKKPMASSAQAWRQEFLDGSAHLLRQRERSKRQQHIAELKALGEEDKLRDLLPSKSRLGDNLS